MLNFFLGIFPIPVVATPERAHTHASPMQTIYYVQAFRAGPGGLEPAQLLLRGREGEARWAAAQMAERYEGVLAWRQEQDYEVGYYGEPEVIVRLGRVPEGLEA